MRHIHKTNSIKKGPLSLTSILGLLISLISINAYAQTPLNTSIDIIHCKANRSGEINVHASGGKPPYVYQWKHDDQETLPTIRNLKPGTYLVTVTDADQNTVTAFGTTLFLTEDELFAGNTFKVYNVSESELIVVQAHDLLTESLKIRLSDSQNHLVAEKVFYQGSTLCHLETNTLYEGQYVLSVLDEDESKTFPVTIKK